MDSLSLLWGILVLNFWGHHINFFTLMHNSDPQKEGLAERAVLWLLSPCLSPLCRDLEAHSQKSYKSKPQGCCPSLLPFFSSPCYFLSFLLIKALLVPTVCFAFKYAENLLTFPHNLGCTMGLTCLFPCLPADVLNISAASRGCECQSLPGNSHMHCAS